MLESTSGSKRNIERYQETRSIHPLLGRAICIPGAARDQLGSHYQTHCYPSVGSEPLIPLPRRPQQVFREPLIIPCHNEQLVTDSLLTQG